MASVEEIIKLSLDDRHTNYQANGENKNIQYVEIDGIKLSDYQAYSFFWEKTYVKSPERAMDGSMSNLDTYTTFITGHFKIDFSLMSIDDYRIFMKLIYKKNEFTVKCYDVVYDKQITIKMYFATQEMPKLWTIVSKKQENLEKWEDYVDLVGVEGCTVEMIGTNTDNAFFENYFD